jgi:CRP-like cAMP-binding protein
MPFVSLAANRIIIANKLLSALPRRDYLRLLPLLEPVTLTSGEILQEAGHPILHVYFPNDALVSLLASVDDRQTIEVGIVGCEGMVGIALALGVTITPLHALVQGSGTAMRMAAVRFRHELPRSLPLQRELHRYAHALMTAVTQTAACNRFHLIEARLARRLLMTRDMLRSERFRFTQEFLAQMLGVRRAGVTKAAHDLRMRGLIDYSRGSIVILDGAGLGAASCSCYKPLRNREPA